MKKTIIAGAAAIALAAPVYAEIEGNLSVTYNSQYGFRGQSDVLDELYQNANAIIPTLVSPDGTQNSFDTEVNLKWALSDNWAIVGGGNLRTTPDTDLDHNSHRLGLSYTNECYSVELGWQNHDIRTGINPLFLPGFGDWNTQEIYAKISTECPLTGGTLTLFAAHDYGELDGTYVELSLNKAWDLCDKTKLDVTVGVSYSFDYWDDYLKGPITPAGFNTGSDWNNAYITVGLAYQATENLTITPYVRYAKGFGALDPSGQPAGSILSGIEESDEVTFGVKASVAF